MKTDPARFAFCSPLIFTVPFFLSSHFYLPPSPLWFSLPFSPSRFRRTSEEKFSVQRWRPRSARLSVVWLSAYVFSGNDTLAPHYRQNAVTSLPSYGPFHWPRWLKRRPGPICSHPQSQKTSLVQMRVTDTTLAVHVTSFCTGQNKLGTSFITQTQAGQVFMTWEGWNASFKEGFFFQYPENMPSKPQNCSKHTKTKGE